MHSILAFIIETVREEKRAFATNNCVAQLTQMGGATRPIENYFNGPLHASC